MTESAGVSTARCGGRKRMGEVVLPVLLVLLLCAGAAVAQVCGNGALDPGEACDDGNTLGGDCCSATCTVEEIRFARLSHLPCLNGSDSVCADGVDNDGDGRTDNDDPSCTGFYALQRLALAAVNGSHRRGIFLDRQARVRRASLPGITVPGYPVAGFCNGGLGVCQCRQSLGGSQSLYPDCQSAGRACAADADCEPFSYPRGPSAAGVCGVNLLLDRDAAVDGFVAAGGDIVFGRGFFDARTIQDLGAFVSSGNGDEVTKGDAPWVGIGLCSPSLAQSCVHDDDCMDPDLCENRLQLDDPFNSSVNRSGNDAPGNFAACRQALDGEIAGVAAAIGGLPGLSLSVATGQPNDRIRIRSGSMLSLSFGGGVHVVDIESLRMGRGAQLILEGQDDTVLILRVAGVLSLGPFGDVSLAGNGLGAGVLSAERVLWYLPGTRGGVRIGRSAHFSGTLLFPERGKGYLAVGATLEGAMLGSRIELRDAALVSHVPFTAAVTGLARPTLELRIVNPTAGSVAVQLSGSRLSGPAADAGATSYSRSELLSPGMTHVLVPQQLAGGIWLHQIVVASTSQEQFQQSLLVLDPLLLNAVDWTLFASVLRVNLAHDAGDGTCDATCTLRDAITTATLQPAPVLIDIDHVAPAFPGGLAHIDIVQNAGLLVQAAGAMIDGTDSLGNPSPVRGFGERIYPSRIVLTAPNVLPSPLDCPCNESPGGSVRVQAEGVTLRGLSLERQLAAEGEICCGDQDLLAFDAGSKNSRIETSRLDGGAAAITSAEVPSGETRPPTGKDCIDADNTGATSAEPIIVDNSELRFCFDRAVKSRRGWLRLQRNWIHHNLRGGVFAQSPDIGFTDIGTAELLRNLVEHNGKNCPSADPASCGMLQVVTRTGASELSAQGPYTALITDANVIRDGVLQGLFFQNASRGSVRNDYVCGMHGVSGGKGILLDRAIGAHDDITVRGTTVVYGEDSGVRVEGNIPGDFGVAADAGRNAFTQNGTFSRRNFVNVLGVLSIVPARGNQWESCYAAMGAMADACDEVLIGNANTNNSIGLVDRVNVADSLPHLSTSAPSLTGVFPSKAWQGLPLVISGSGFDAVSGHSGRVGGDCGALASSNSCSPLSGTCVEFLLDGEWTPAADILGITPTTLSVRSPVACALPVPVRVRRYDLDGAEQVSNTVLLCTN